MKNILHDKHLASLEKMGENIQEQRIKVFNESTEDFAKRMNSIYNGNFSSDDVILMENGDGEVSIHTWLTAWQLMHVDDKIISASKSEASLFLARAKTICLEESYIASKTPK